MAINTVIQIRGEDRTKEAFRSVQRSMRTLQKTVGGLQASIAGFVGTAGLGAMSSQLLKTADALGKTSNRLGLTTADLQSLSFAAEQSGIATSTFEMALQRFTRRAAEAAGGTGEAKDALEQLGIVLTNSDGSMRDSATLLRLVAGAFADIPDQAERVRIAFKLFDSEGVKLVNLLQKGSENLEMLEEKFRNTGATISDDFIKNAEKANDQLNLMSKAFSGSLAVALSGVLAQFTATEESMSGLRSIARDIGSFLNFLAMGYKILAEEIRFIIDQMTTGFGKGFKVIKAQFNKFIADISFGLKDSTKAQEALLKAQTDYNTSIADGLKKHNDRIDVINNEFKAGKTALKELTKQEKEVQKVTKQTNTIQNTAREDKLQKDKLAAEEEMELIKDLEFEYAVKDANIIKSAQARAEAERQLTFETAKGTINTIVGMSAAIANESRQLFELHKAASIAAVTINAFEASSKAMAQLGVFGPIAAGVIYALAIANVAKIASTQYPGRAKGGDVAGGKSYIVGEKGPEVFTPGRTGTITPNNQMGGTTNITFRIQALDARGIDQLLVSRKDMIIGMINAAQNRRLRRTL